MRHFRFRPGFCTFWSQLHLRKSEVHKEIEKPLFSLTLGCKAEDLGCKVKDIKE